MIERVIRFCLENKLVVLVLALFLMVAGLVVAPFDWELDWMERRPVPVDAIPDLSDVQVIIKTSYPGQAPQVVWTDAERERHERAADAIFLEWSTPIYSDVDHPDERRYAGKRRHGDDGL